MSLMVITTHPVQYHAPVYRALHSDCHIPTTVVYGSDFSIKGYADKEFGTAVAWDTDLLSGYESIFLSESVAGEPVIDTQLSTWGLDDVLRRVKPDVILLQGYRPGFDIRAFFKVRNYGSRLLFRGEVTDHARQRHFAKRIVRDVFLCWYYRHFDRLLYIGTHARRHYERLGLPAEKLVFAPYCVDTRSFQITEAQRQQQRATTRRALQIADEQIVLLMSGKVIYHKRPDLLMDAVKTLPEQLRQQLVILFLGDGEMRDELQIMANQAPFVATRFVGFQNQTQLSPYYNASDLLIFTSLSETWGLVVNEGLHHGLPCIVSESVGSALDLVTPGYNGDIIAVNSVSALVESLQKTLPLLKEPDLAQRCQERVQRFTVEAAAQGIAEAYHAVIATL